ncbi:MAG: 2-succinyl-5-enolpyruvyl-6-hydroxy-3-cyclohexene-1-carboxylic-acid synthase, partial [Chlamydiia bacterium]|nr:2-succinyl-5-enolpyruvyl-6-hydroxy-3-cyclohexene-1-carboxylic-acid synthase [Chlamydiia bacterium]
MRWFEETIETLLSLGVREFCVCAGKRNAPLVSLLDGIEGIQIYRHFEERSAAFFALGRTLDSGRPVAVVTTSGTAAGELLPAMMEATYVGAPLIAVTADRPRSYRGSGAPQACEQKEIFGVYASVSIDCEEREKLVLPIWDKKSPLHLNLCLEEPKILPSIRMRATEETFSVSHPPFQGECLLEFTRRVKKPLVMVSTLHPSERQGVEAFLRSFKAPVILEGVSGLRGLESLKPYVLKSTESVQPFDGILKLGGVPTLRAWRDLEDLEGKIELLSISRTRYRGLSWGAHVTADLATLPHLSGEWDFAELKNQDRLASAEIVELLQKYPTSEPGMVHALSKKMEADARVYLGNSLPIREWDLAACEEAPRAVWASRGLNGIDGQLSTALGLKADWALLG